MDLSAFVQCRFVNWLPYMRTNLEAACPTWLYSVAGVWDPCYLAGLLGAFPTRLLCMGWKVHGPGWPVGGLSISPALYATNSPCMVLAGY